MSPPQSPAKKPADAVASPSPAESPSPSPSGDAHQEEDDVSSKEIGEISESESDGADEKTWRNAKDGNDNAAPPLPNESVPEGPPLPTEPVPGANIAADAAAVPPLPNEPAPQPEDDGWDCQWDASTNAWFFHNRFTGKTQWDNPRIPQAAASSSAAPGTTANIVPQPPAHEKPAAGGYNPAIHGDYDPNAWYAKGATGDGEEHHGDNPFAIATDPLVATATFNCFTGQFQTADVGPGQHSDEAKTRRQMNAFFDVDAAANAHNGRSLKAERSAELKQFKEKRRARKEEKRRAWLRD